MCGAQLLKYVVHVVAVVAWVETDAYVGVATMMDEDDTHGLVVLLRLLLLLLLVVVVVVVVLTLVRAVLVSAFATRTVRGGAHNGDVGVVVGFSRCCCCCCARACTDHATHTIWTTRHSSASRKFINLYM